MNSNNQLSIFGPSSSLAIEALNERRAAQQAEREERESHEELAHKSKTVILRVPAAELDPSAKPSLIVKFNIKFKTKPGWKEIPNEMRFSILKFTFPGQRMFDLNLQPCILIDPSFAVRSAIDYQTTEQRNLNSAAHAAANGQGDVRAKPPIALSISKATREYALETYKLLEQPLANFPGISPRPIGRAYFDPEVDILHCQSKIEYVSAGKRGGPTVSSFQKKEVIQRIAIPNEYFSTINYTTGPRPVLLKYTSLKEIIVLVQHLHCCIHGNEARTSVGRRGTQHPKEHYIEKFKTLVEGKWAAAMAQSWGSFPSVRYAGDCRCS
ncbi:uncharacterized protein Bfra_009662 [Botrytis fragariae]|uniref:2EXR domain-containing protein n=1 Tax=Botrytis fragariae TaxID=1964551 RepID=A0A8H6AMT4_9HELO|nr:uncharacterized protein Bfra_009662 [Botrytis fragariae]KAF5870279.1 hypothetical protein Bfra_009662 [Botrytis fragariae]